MHFVSLSPKQNYPNLLSFKPHHSFYIFLTFHRKEEAALLLASEGSMLLKISLNINTSICKTSEYDDEVLREPRHLGKTDPTVSLDDEVLREPRHLGRPTQLFPLTTRFFVSRATWERPTQLFPLTTRFFVSRATWEDRPNCFP